MTHKRCLNPTCRRLLTSKESQERGYGRRCWEERRPVPIGVIIPRLAIARRAAEIVPGQLELDFLDPEGAADETERRND